MDILDRDIHTERRRVFWQTAYISALEKCLEAIPILAPGFEPGPSTTGSGSFITATAGSIAAAAGAHAAEAVKQFDRWEAEQAAPARANTGVRPPGPDPEDSPYLGDSR